MTPAKHAKAAPAAAPSFRELTRDESEALLARNHVGRVAFTFRDHVDIEPVHYVYADGWLHCRTAPGGKITIIRHHPWIAFEVDEVEGLFDWRSVIVHGAVHLPDPNGSPDDREAYARTLEHIRALVPDALTPADPSPERSLPFRIHIDAISGRAASTGDSHAGASNRRSR